jgi:hypothetical protein
MKDDTRALIEELVFALSRSIRGADNEGTAAVVDAVAKLGFATLEEDVRAEVLALGAHWNWDDAEEFFRSIREEG